MHNFSRMISASSCSRLKRLGSERRMTIYLGIIVTNTLLYLDNGGVPLSVTLKIN